MLLYPAYARGNCHQGLPDSAELPRQEGKVLKAMFDFAFINKSYFEERTREQFIAGKLESLKAQRPVVVIN